MHNNHVSFSIETKRILEEQLKQNITEIEELKKSNSISQKEYQQKIEEANSKNAEGMESLKSEVVKLRDETMKKGVDDKKHVLDSIGMIVEKLAMAWMLGKKF